MSGTQTLKCILVFVPFFVLAVYSGSIYDDLRSNYIPDTVPAVKMTMAGQGITAAISNLALLWNFFEFAPSIQMTSAKAFLFVSCVDFLIGALLLLAVGLQSTYLPHTLSGCSNAASLGLAAPGNTTNLFRFVGQLDDDTPEDICQSYMTTWIMGIVLGSVSLFSSYSALLEAQSPPVGRYGRRSPGIDIIGWFIGLIPQFLSTPVKFTMLWLKKWGQWRSTPKTFEKASMEMVVLTPGPPEPRPPFKYQPKTNPKFLELLSSYPIVTAISEGLHYADLIQLSLVSKDVYDTLFPRSKPSTSSSLKKHCCLKGANTACWCCKTQICWEGPVSATPCNPKEYCATFKYIAKADTTWHLNYCTQYCSKCFRTRMCRSAGPRELSPKCSCNNDGMTLGKNLCRFCLKLPDTVAKERVEKREHEEMLARAAQQVNCGGCSKRLPKTGPRWWACGHCRKECRSPFHPQWAGGAEV